MTLLEKFEHLMKSRQLNKRQLSILTNIPYSTIDNIWKRNTDSMRLPTFKTLCDFFNVTMESMAYDDQEIRYRDDIKADALSRTEKEVISMYSTINDDAKRIVEKTLKEAYNIEIEKKEDESSDQSRVG